jgi:AcrR family transcriptional regulator
MPASHPSSTRAGRDAADRLEPRAVRSRKRLLGAVREALELGPIDGLSVADICRRAGVNRATFYGHWPDARAAAIEALTEVVEAIATVDAAAITATSDLSALARLYETALAGQLARTAQDRALYRQLVDNPLFEQGLRSMLEHRAALAVEAMATAGAPVRGEATTAAAYLAGGVAAATLQWIRSDRTDIDAFARSMIDQLPGWWPRA